MSTLLARNADVLVTMDPTRRELRGAGLYAVDGFIREVGEQPGGPAKSVTIDTDEGTWMSLDVSPDGKTVVFDLLGDLYTVPIAGGDAKPTDVVATPKVAGERDAERSQDFCWLADGTLLMARGNRLLRFDPRKPEAGFVTLAEFAELPGDIKRLAASKDGKHVAFTSDRDGADNVWVLPVAGGKPTQVSKEDFRLLNSPAWSHDGKWGYLAWQDPAA